VLIPHLSKLAITSYRAQCLTDFALGIFADPIHDRYIGAYVAGDRIGVSEILLTKELAKTKVTGSLTWSSRFDPELATNGDSFGKADVSGSFPMVSWKSL